MKKNIRILLLRLSVLCLGGFLYLPATASIRQAPALNVTVEIEHFYPVAGSSVNQAGTVGNFGTFHWVGQKSVNQTGTIESTSVAPSVLFSSMNAIGISLSALSISESAPVGQVVGSLSSTNLSNPVYSLINNGDGKFSLLGDQIRVSQSLDFETQSSHIIRVRVTGTEGEREQDFTILVEDVMDEDDDGDGLSQARELELGTNPLLSDTDGDGFSDGVEINAGTNPLDAESFPVWSIDQLELNSKKVEENLPAGSRVGDFVYDGIPVSSDVKLSLVKGDEPQAFTVDQNGTLLTKSPLDFEKMPNYEITVLVEHSSGAVFEKKFIIQVIDSFIPIVRTVKIARFTSSGATLEGRVMDEGETGGVSERGFLISSSPNSMIDQNDVQTLSSGNGGGEFLVTVDGLEAGKKYFVRAYAVNGEGIAYGSEVTLRTDSGKQAPLWANAVPETATDWWRSQWFGTFYRDGSSDWIMHAELGWLYPLAHLTDGVWLWKQNMGWLWTDTKTFPFLYQNMTGGWVYFHGSSQNSLLFYHYREERWIRQSK